MPTASDSHSTITPRTNGQIYRYREALRSPLQHPGPARERERPLAADDHALYHRLAPVRRGRRNARANGLLNHLATSAFASAPR